MAEVYQSEARRLFSTWERGPAARQAIMNPTRPQLAHVRHDDLMSHLLELLADPDGVSFRFHRDPYWRQISEPLLGPRWGCAKPSPVYNFTFLVERALMTPNVPKIDPDRHLDL